jgi:hypothetical protein
VISDDLAGVDLYLNQDAFEQRLDSERTLGYEAWRAQFLVGLDEQDMWKRPADPAP